MSLPSPTSVERPGVSLPPGFADSDLFRRWGADALKLYLWLRAHVRPGRALPGEEGAGLRRGYLEADASGAEIEAAIGVSKNTVTKLARELRDLGVATFDAGRAGYHFRLGEWLARRTGDSGLALRAEAFYLEALLSSRQEAGRAE